MNTTQRSFARFCALSVAHLWPMPKRIRDALNGVALIGSPMDIDTRIPGGPGGSDARFIKVLASNSAVFALDGDPGLAVENAILARIHARREPVTEPSLEAERQRMRQEFEDARRWLERSPEGRSFHAKCGTVFVDATFLCVCGDIS